MRQQWTPAASVKLVEFPGRMGSNGESGVHSLALALGQSRPRTCRMEMQPWYDLPVIAKEKVSSGGKGWRMENGGVKVNEDGEFSRDPQCSSIVQYGIL